MTTPTETAAPEGIRWGRVIVGGLLVEVVLGVITGLAYGLDRLDELYQWVMLATVVSALLAGAWTGRGVSRPVLHGALAGVAAILLYAVIAVIGLYAAPDQVNVETLVLPENLVTHALKVVAAAAGAWLVGRKAA